jgi:hypothetical protein
MIRIAAMRVGAEHESGEQQGKVHHADFKQVTREHAAFGVGDRAKDAAEAQGVAEIEEAKDYGNDGVDRSIESKPEGGQTDGDHGDGVEDGFDNGGQAIGLDHGKHADSGTRVVIAVHPGDGHEVRELPDEEDCEEGYGGPLDAAACGSPAEERTHGAWESTDERRKSGDALERRVDGDIGERREKRQGDSEQVGVEQQPPRTEGQSADAGNNSLGEGDATGGQGAVGGADHARVGGPLESLVEGSGACRDESDAEQGVEQTALQGGDSRLH